MGEVVFDRFFVIEKDADRFVSGIYFDKTMKKGEFYGQTHGPKFAYLSENI